MKTIKTAILLLLVLFLVLGCSDDDKKSSNFYLDITQIDTNQNVNNRSFGIYKNDVNFYSGISDNEFILDSMVLVVPYRQEDIDLILAGEARVELTVRDSTYTNHYPIDSSFDYDEFYLMFVVDGFQGSTETYTVTYIYGDIERNYSITIPYVNYLTEFSVTDVLNSQEIMTFDWDLNQANSYQLVDAEQKDDNFDNINAIFGQRLKSSVRRFTFPEEYNYSPEYRNNFYGLTQVKQTQTSDLIGISMISYAVNVSEEDGWEKKKSYDVEVLQSHLKSNFKFLNKAILQNVEFNN